MAIYSCNLASIGRTTHAPGTAGAHLRYISREGAEPVVEAHVIPLDPIAARTWMDREEQVSRANARLCDKVRIAIPRELGQAERLQLVREFVRDVTQDRVPWMFAIHQRGEDEHNPHAHIVLRDRDLETGKRVLRLSDSARDRIKAGLEPKAVEWIRERWERLANDALARAGHAQRIDRRTLDAQGIDRTATIHVGPRGEEVERHVQRPNSKARINGAGREIDYPAIDKGRTRKERNAEIVDLNLEKAARSPDFETRQWAIFERAQTGLDRQLEQELSAQARERTKEQRAAKSVVRAELASLRDRKRAENAQARGRHREKFTAAISSLRQRQAKERGELLRSQRSLWSRLRRAVDLTGNLRRRHIETRKAQIVAHKAERTDLARQSRGEWATHRKGLAERYAPREETLAAKRRETLAALKLAHQRGEASADAKLQLRERERETERQRTAAAIRAAKSRAVPSPGAATTNSNQADRRSSVRAALERTQFTVSQRQTQPEYSRQPHSPGQDRSPGR